MKTLRSLALIQILALLLCGCGESAPPEAEETPVPAVQTAAALTEAAAPVPTPTPAPVLAPEETGVLRISELMVKNRATLMADDGGFYDWAELQNISDAPLSLAGWALSDGPDQKPWALPERTLEPGECCLIFAAGKDAALEGAASFALSAGEELCLFAPSGAPADRLVCPELRADESLARTERGEAAATFWASPGYPNTDEGYAAFCEARRAAGPLVISEVSAANVSHPARPDALREDWVELKNVSGNVLSLDGWLLWDGSHEDEPFALPARTLAPGECAVIVCGGDGAEDAPFGLDAQHDRLYLGTAEGIADYVALHDLPVDGSCGREDGRGGFFYYSVPSLRSNNSGGCRMVSEAPEALTEDGVYNGIDALSVALEAPGEIRYSLGGASPLSGAQLYTGPLSLSKTTVLRAYAQEPGKVPSRVVTLNYIINENHSLPVLSLCLDDPAFFRTVYLNGYKGYELPGSLSLYEEGRSFTQACGMQMSGSGSLELPKKSVAVMFRGCYGDGDLNCDVFDSGVNRYASLQIRAGEAYPTTVIQSDLFQDACLAMSDDCLSQHSKHCVLYINGAYYGVFCLKEKFSRQYYASLKGVSKDSVTVLKYPVAQDSDFAREVLRFCESADLTDPAQYARFCELVDVDSLIDWYLIEGLSGNTDIGGNLRLFRSTEDGGRWSWALYDLDWGFYSSEAIFNNLNTDNYYHSGQVRTVMEAAMRSADFRDRILTRYAEVWNTALSNESFLALIDLYEQRLAPEIPRDRQLWGNDETVWRLKLDQLRSFIRDSDPQRLGVEHFCAIWKISDETRKQYFGW